MMTKWIAEFRNSIFINDVVRAGFEINFLFSLWKFQIFKVTRYLSDQALIIQIIIFHLNALLALESIY